MEYKKSIRDALEYVVVKKKGKFITTFSNEGDIVVSDKQGKQVQTYSLPIYRPPIMKELHEMEQDRRNRIVKAEEEINRLYPLMRAAIKRINEIDDDNLGEKMTARSEYIGIIREIEVASARYSEELSPEKNIESLKKLPRKMIDVERYNDDTIIEHSVNLLKRRPFEMQKMFERDGEIPVELIETPADLAAQQQGIAEKFIPIFQDQWLSPDIPINFQYAERMYSSVRQAMEAWKARTGGDYEREMAILKALTPMDARSLGIPNKEIPAEIILDILRAVNKFNSARKTLIRNLEEGTYMYMDTDVILGVGFEGPVEGIKSRENWMGQNKYGIAITQMIAEIKATPETVSRRKVVVKQSSKVAPTIVKEPEASALPPNPFNLF